MDGILATINAALPLLYAGLVAIYALLLARDFPWTRKWGPGLLAATLVIHGTYVILEGAVAGRNPIANKFELFTLVALAMAVSYAWVEWRRKNPYTGFFPLFLCLLLQICSSLGRPAEAEVKPLLQGPLFAWHTASAAVSLAALSVGAVYGVLFMSMYALLKRGMVGEFALRMPSLDTLSAMSLHAVEVGFVALTLAVGLGDVWVMRTPGVTMADPKIWSTFVVWAVYAACLLGRFAGRWGGARIVGLNLTGYVLLLGSIVVVPRAFGTFHSFTG
jgi:HemX protein